MSRHHTSQEPTRPASLPLSEGDAAPASCCRFAPWAIGSLAAAATVAVALAAYFAGRNSQPEPTSAWQLPPIEATAAVTSEKFSMATGPVSGESEGLFVLDHNSGLLQCSVIYPRAGQFAANFTANVGEALATGGKGGSYMMATGIADFPRSSNNPIGSSVVYVLDTSTGKYACYAVPFNRVMMNSNQPQAGPLRLLAIGSANPLIDRDALR